MIKIKKTEGSALLSVIMGMIILTFVFSGLFYAVNGLTTSAKKMEQANNEYVNLTSIVQMVRGKSYQKLVNEIDTPFDENYKYSIFVKEYLSKRTDYKVAKINIVYKDDEGIEKQKTFIINKIKEKFSQDVSYHASLDADNRFWVYLSKDEEIEGKIIADYGYLGEFGRSWRSPKIIPISLNGNEEYYYLHVKVQDLGSCAGLFGEISLPEDSGFIFEGTGTRQIFAEPVNIEAWKISSTGWKNYQKPIKNYCYAWGNSLWYDTNNNFYGTREGFFSTKLINTYGSIYEL